MFITIEGIDGAGKTTLLESVRSFFVGLRDMPARRLDDWQDPGAGQSLKARFLAEKDPERQLAIINTARLLTMESTTLPALAAGKVVIYDRYLHSTLAYQGALGLDPQRILSEHQALRLPMPDLCILLDVGYSVARERMEKRGLLNQFDRKGPDFFARATRILQHYAEQHSRFVCRVNANRSADDVAIATLTHIEEYLDRRAMIGQQEAAG